MAFLNFRFSLLLVASVTLITLSGCRPKKRVLSSPPHYDFSQAAIDKLDLKLQEISGLTWDADINVFYAVNDEVGKLFTMDKESKAINGEYEFGKKGDYEDVAVLNNKPYILRSDGTIFRFIKNNEGETTVQEAGKVPVEGSNDFETMYSDPQLNGLIVICKNCNADDKKSVSAYIFYPDSIGFDKKPYYILDAEKIEKLSPFGTSKFQPSGAAIHPKLHKLYIISSASNQLVIADLQGNAESVYKLSPNLFLQPEGIAFKNSGDMYIANEGLGSKATLLKFAYIPETDQAKKEIEQSGYNFSNPDERMDLDKHLKEISGMAYIPKTNLILAENDEKGEIFTVDFTNKNDLISKEKFGGKSDYEDIVYTDTAIYMLVSTGSVVRVSTRDTSLVTSEYSLALNGTNEFEAMYLTGDGKSLILLCKDCSKEKDEIRKAYRFDLATQKFDTELAYTIDVNSIRQMLNDDKAEFKPSAAGINPLNGKLYIIASVGKLMVIASKDGKVEAVIKLDPELFNQPEGLTFAPNGDLYISNEAGEKTPTILKFLAK
ncbi:MAG: SdiA-regulated domain-containing protein [Chitinophagaceae bacterium]